MQEVREQSAAGKWSWGRCALLVALCLVVYLPGFCTIPPVDRDESRFAQASRQMFESVALPAAQRDPALHSGGLLIPMVQDRPRLNKPPLIYWLQAASAAVLTGGDPLRDTIWMYRVPTLIAAIVAVLLTWRIGSAMFGERVGIMGAAMLAVCPMLAWEAHQARSDMVLLAWTTGAMGVLWKVWEGEIRRDKETKRGPGLRWVVAFWLCIAGGVMTKGPITPMVAGLAALCLSIATRRWGWLLALRPALGVLVVAAAIGPWVAGVAQHVGWHEYWSRIYDETIGRSVSAKEGHWGPPGYHLVLLVVLFWPGSLLTGWSVLQAWRRRAEGPLLFCLAWVTPTWIVFEIVGTKLPHYVMPLYPALAILSAWGLDSLGERTRSLRPGIVIWALAGAAIAAIPVVLADPRVGGGPRGIADPATALFFLVVAGCSFNAWRGMVKESMRFGIAQMAVVALVAFGVVLPRCRALWVSRELADAVGSRISNRGRPIAAVGFHEDSLVFWARGRLQKLNADEAAAWRAANPTGILIQPAGLLPAPKGAPVVRGFNYSNGKQVELEIVEGETGQHR
jgi:4-amino-4-deoxy-L-arabinose transferase-like glycosyltransferase